MILTNGKYKNKYGLIKNNIINKLYANSNFKSNLIHDL